MREEADGNGANTGSESKSSAAFGRGLDASERPKSPRRLAVLEAPPDAGTTQAWENEAHAQTQAKTQADLDGAGAEPARARWTGF
jgi:hypothetical protein